jgi:hypothetical protein
MVSAAARELEHRAYIHHIVGITRGKRDQT